MHKIDFDTCGGSWKFRAQFGKARFSEANIQAEFYHECRLLGVNCLLELNTPVGRLDIAILNKDCSAIVAIVEVKRGYFNLKSNQFERYRSLGVPVYGLGKLYAVNQLVKNIKDWHLKETVTQTCFMMHDLPSLDRPKRMKDGPKFKIVQVGDNLNLKKDITY